MLLEKLKNRDIILKLKNSSIIEVLRMRVERCPPGSRDDRVATTWSRIELS